MLLWTTRARTNVRSLRISNAMLDAAISSTRYFIEERIARGGMGDVYRARMRGLAGVEKVVALKVLREDRTGTAENTQLFAKEMRATIELSHANIVQAFDVAQVDDRLFLVLEYIDGASLATILERLALENRKLDVGCALAIAIDMLKGLEHAHRPRGDRKNALIHCDISPHNVLVSREGQVKLADFGIAVSGEAQSEIVRGKIAYMAPEQLRGLALDERTDVYGVGGTLYEMLVGTSPVRAATAMEALASVITRTISAPRTVRADVPDVLSEIVMRALDPEPYQRFETASAMLEALEGCSRQLGLYASAAKIAALVDVPSHAAQAIPGFDALLGAELEWMGGTENVPRFATKDISATRPNHVAKATDVDHRRNAGRSEMARRRSTSVGLVAMSVGVGALAVGAFSLGVFGGGVNETVPPPTNAANLVAKQVAPSREPDTAQGRPLQVEVDAQIEPVASVPRRKVTSTKGAPPIPESKRSPSTVAAPAPAASGFLSVNSLPWSEVYLDGHLLRATPIVRLQVEAGSHRVELRRPDGQRELRTVDIRPGGVSTIGHAFPPATSP